MSRWSAHRVAALLLAIAVPWVAWSQPVAAGDRTRVAPVAVGARGGAGPAVAGALDLSLRDLELGAALQVIAGQAGHQLALHGRLNQRVSVDLAGVDLETALDQTIGAHPFTWAIEGNTIHVFPVRAGPIADDSMPAPGPTAPLPVAVPPATVGAAAEPVIHRVIVVQHRRAEELRDLLGPLLGGQVRLVPDVRTNSLLAHGPTARIDEIERLARQMDAMPATREIEDQREFLSEVFSLEHITSFADLEANLNLILYGDAGSGRSGPPAVGAAGAVTTAPSPGEPPPVVPIRREYYLLDKVRKVLMITASRDKMAIIREYFARVNTPLPQVSIEAAVVALDTGFERTLGIDWSLVGGYRGPVRPTDRPLGTPRSPFGQGTPAQTNVDPTRDFQFGRWDLSQLTAVLQSAEERNLAQILSRPRIMAVTGSPALIHVGTRYPYKQSTTIGQTGTTENITFVDVGIKLNVTPEINPKAGTIVLKLHPEVSDVAGFRNDAPIITTRQADTVVEIANGQTLVIGGLLRTEHLRDRRAVPILKDIPLLGEFFRFSRRTRNRSNLLVMITPRIVDARGMPLPIASSEVGFAPGAAGLRSETVAGDATGAEAPAPGVPDGPHAPPKPTAYYRQRWQQIRQRYLGETPAGAENPARAR